MTIKPVQNLLHIGRLMLYILVLLSLYLLTNLNLFVTGIAPIISFVLCAEALAPSLTLLLLIFMKHLAITLYLLFLPILLLLYSL